jgi:hypothetical protein
MKPLAEDWLAWADLALALLIGVIGSAIADKEDLPQSFLADWRFMLTFPLKYEVRKQVHMTLF